MQRIKTYLMAKIAIVAALAGAALTRFGAVFYTWKDFQRDLVIMPVRQRFGQSGAVVSVLSTLITGRDSTPPRIKSRILQGAPIMHARGVVAIANGDSIASKYYLFSLPSNAVPISLRISSPDIGTTTAADIGLYKTTRDGGAVVDADFFKAALALNAGALSKSEQLTGNIITVANGEKMLYEHLALSADSQIPYDVVLTLTGAADAAGSVLVECDYVLG